MKEMFTTISNLTTYNHALVEAGHFYADQELSAIDITGVEIGLATMEALSEMGMETTPCLFVDNYNAEDTRGLYNLHILQTLGLQPEVIKWEAQMAVKAEEVLADLKENNLVKVKKTGAQFLKKPWVQIVNRPETGNSPTGRFSCAFLDALCYIEKHEEYGGICVTVLPEEDEHHSYRHQQANTKLVLQGLGVDVPILNVYYTEEGEISLEFDY